MRRFVTGKVATVLTPSRLRTLQTIATAFSITLLGMLSTILVSRSLGPEGRGSLAAALLWPVLLVYLSQSGFFSSFLYYGARTEISGGRLVGLALVSSAVGALLFIPLGFIVMPYLLRGQTSDTIHLSQMYLAVIPILTFTEYLSALLNARAKFTWWNILQLVTPAGYFIGSLVMVVISGITVERIILLHLSLNVIRMILTFLVVIGSGFGLTLRLNRDIIAQVTSYGLKAHAGSISNLANSQLDQVAMAAFLSPTSLGYYAVGSNTARIILTIPLAMRSLMAPQVSSQASSSGGVRIVARYVSTYWGMSIVAFPLVAAAIYFGIPLLYGGEFRNAIPVSGVLLIGSLLLGGKEIIGAGARALGQPWLSSKAEIVGLLCTALALAVLLPTLGLMGAAISSVIAYTAALLFVSTGFSTHFGVSGSTLARPRLVNPKKLLASGPFRLGSPK